MIRLGGTVTRASKTTQMGGEQVMELSRFAHVVIDEAGDRTIILNTLTGAIGTLRGTTWPLNDVPDNVREGLEQLGVASEPTQQQIRENWLDGRRRRTVEINLEMGLACNLGCHYCYQNPYKDNNRPSYAPGPVLRRLIELARTSFGNLSGVQLSLIGGEPLLYRDFVENASGSFREICAEFGLASKILVNTNGTRLISADVEAFDVIAIAVTRQPDHDRLRPTLGGRASHATIWKNLSELAPVFNRSGTDLHLRYNAHGDNLHEFGAFLQEVSGLEIGRVKVRAFPVINYAENSMVKPISMAELRGLNTQAIHWEVSTGREVRTFPTASLSRCSAYDFSAIKVHADGSLSTCDAHLPVGVGKVQDLKEWRVDLQNLFPELDRCVVLEDAQCSSCKWLAMCGGRTFCKSRGIHGMLQTCDFCDYDLDEFLRIFGRESRVRPHIFADAPTGS